MNRMEMRWNPGFDGELLSAKASAEGATSCIVTFACDTSFRAKREFAKGCEK